jgi:hypothetical protein
MTAPQPRRSGGHDQALAATSIVLRHEGMRGRQEATLLSGLLRPDLCSGEANLLRQ